MKYLMNFNFSHILGGLLTVATALITVLTINLDQNSRINSRSHIEIDIQQAHAWVWGDKKNRLLGGCKPKIDEICETSCNCPTDPPY